MSTPIETNTEQLQEVLQQVYNLPSISGGSSEPDLVIGLNWTNTKTKADNGYPFRSQNLSANDVTIESGDLSAVVEKIKQGIPVRVSLKAVNFYGIAAWAMCMGEADFVSVLSNSEYPSCDDYKLHISAIVRNDVYSDALFGGLEIGFLSIVFDISTGNVERCSYSEI